MCIAALVGQRGQEGDDAGDMASAKLIQVSIRSSCLPRHGLLMLQIMLCIMLTVGLA